MKKEMLSKAVVIGVILLFFGIGIQPAFALVPKSSVNTIEQEEDCDCNDMDRLDLNRAELIFAQIKVVTNILLLKFENIPDVKEICYEILDTINSNKKLNNPNFCNRLENYTIRIEQKYLNLDNLHTILREKSLFFGGFLTTFIVIFQALTYFQHQLLLVAGYQLCNWPWPTW